MTERHFPNNKHEEISNKNIQIDIIDAIGNDNLELVKEILPLIDKYNTFIDDQNEDLNILTYSLRCNAYKVFDYILTDFDINFEIEGSIIVWRHIISSLKVKIEYVQNILSRVHDINHISCHNHTILHTIIYSLTDIIYHDITKENRQYILCIIKMLIEYGADPLIENNIGDSSIDMAILDNTNPIEVLTLLLNNIKKYVPIKTILYVIEHADETYQYDIIDMLLPHVKDINELYRDYSILWYVKNDDVINSNIIELLEENGAL